MRDCNKNKCKPVCNPCTKQPEIYYCGKPIECLSIDRGDKINSVIKSIGDKVCEQGEYLSLMTYINIVPAEESDCPYGGYEIQNINSTTDEVVSSYFICNTEPLSIFNNSEFVSQPTNINFDNGEGTVVETSHDSLTNTTTVKFNVSDQHIEITYSEGLDLINNEEIKEDASYYVTDRGWYLRGINSKNFSIDGHIEILCPKPIYYTKSGAVKAVFDKFSGSYTTGDIVVHGGKVWENLSGLNGTVLDYFNLSTDWSVVTDSTYYEPVLLRMHCDYIGDWVFRYEDNKNNVINVPYNIYGSISSASNVWADWNNPNFSDNDCRPILNNASTTSSPCNIRHNIGHFDIINNKASIIQYNKCIQGIRGNDSTNISFNSTTTIIDNTVTSILFNSGQGASGSAIITNNTGSSITSNIIQSVISNNTIDTFQSNTIRSTVIGNTFQTFTGNTVFKPVLNNTQYRLIASGFDYNEVYGDVKNNSINGLFSNNTVMGNIEDNESLKVTKSRCFGNILNNEALIIEESDINNVESNSSTLILDCNMRDVGQNLDSVFINLRSLDANENQDCNFSTCFVEFTISYNINVAAINNTCTSIESNKNIEEIRYNHITGTISENEDLKQIIGNINRGEIVGNKGTGHTDCQIVANVNNGSILRNVFDDDNLEISYNNNNGDIGTSLSDTTRSVSILGVISNL